MSRHSRLKLLLSLILSVLAQGAVPAEDWPQFRGHGGLAVAKEPRTLPAVWSAEQNLLWKTRLPGPGSSSPIIVGDRIFITCYTGYGLDIHKPGDINDLTRHLLCLDRRGKILWQRAVPAAQPERPFLLMHALHGYASSTPVADRRRVYVFFGKSGVFAYDWNGNQVWRASVGSDANPWGSASSPILVDDLVIVNASMESGKLVALHKSDGKQAWAAPGMEMTWSTPFLLLLPSGKRQLLVSAKYKLHSFNPTTGAVNWVCDAMPEYVATCLTSHDDVVYAIGTKERVGMAFRVNSNPEVLWQIRKGSNVSSPVYYKGHLYWAHENYGIAYCARAEDGQIVYEEKLVPEGQDQRIYASAVIADGKLYYTSRRQGTFVLEASPKFNLLAQNVITGDSSVFNGTPAISEGRIYLRSNEYLYCLAESKETVQRRK
jgi:outer membrane protein assembly factor BamB